MVAHVAAAAHYDTAYFDWQKSIGAFAATADAFKFRDEVGPADRVLDLGCGGGFILEALDAREKLGVEINPSARARCRSAGIRAVASLAEVEDGWADVAISHHALEHMTDPHGVLCALREKVRVGGKVVLVVPCESHRRAYRPGDINNHLFTWSPMNLGNLFAAAGFQVASSERLTHRWPPKPMLVQRLVGWRLFDALSIACGFLRRDLAQVRVIATRTG